MKFISWFSGIGGFDEALRVAGMELVGGVEIDKFARRVYEARVGRPPWFPEDINAVEPDDIPDAELWCGGSPCQGFSVAGQREGLKDDRSGLLRVWLSLLESRKPRFLLFENVPGIFSANGGRDWGELVARLDEIGYVGAWRVLDARHFGVPQRRRRVFLLAEFGKDASRCAGALFEGHAARPPSLVRDGYSWRGRQTSLVRAPTVGDWCNAGTWSAGWCATMPLPEAPEETVASSLSGILEREVPARFYLSPLAAAGILRRAAKRGRELPATLRAALEAVAQQGGTVVLERQQAFAFDLAQITSDENRTRPEPGQPAPALAATNRVHVATLRAADGHHGRSSPRGDGSDSLVQHGGVRRLTPTEAEKLQGLPDGWTCLCGCSPYSIAVCTCPDGNRYRALGNSVARPVVEWIARRLCSGS